MTNVIELALHPVAGRRKRRPREPIRTAESTIHIYLHDDGSHTVRLAGAYAHSHPLAIEALAEVVALLAPTVRHHRGL